MDRRPAAQCIVGACVRVCVAACSAEEGIRARPFEHDRATEHTKTGETGTMAKQRRDELAAYTFARKRTVAAFLAPSPGGSEEGAPRPIHTVMPSLAVGIVLVIGFIAWGVIKPT